MKYFPGSTCIGRPLLSAVLFALTGTSVVLASGPAVQAAGLPGTSQGREIVGQPWIGHPGITETVNQIMDRDPLPSLSLNSPLAVHPLGLGPVFQSNPYSPAVSQWPPRNPALAPGDGIRAGGGGLRSPQTKGVSFQAEEVTEALEVPPDTQGDVGPDQILTASNGRIKVFDRTGVLGPLNTTEDNFFASVNTDGTTTSDPRVVYDRISQRWFVSIISTHTPNLIEVAVSSGSHISGASSFTFFSFEQDLVGTTPNSDTNDFADYDTLGVDANGVYIGCNMFSSGAFSETTGWVIKKSSLLSGTLVVTPFRGLLTGSTDGPYTPQGVTNDDPTATVGYFVGVGGTLGELALVTISNPGGTPSISTKTFTVPSVANPINVPAEGSTDPLAAIDTRLFPARLHHGHLTVGHNIQVDATGVASSTGGRDGSRWYNITSLTSTPPTFESGTLFDPAAASPRSFWFPSIVYTGQGHLALGASAAGANEFPEIVAAGRLSTDAAGTTEAPTTVQTSSQAYNLQTSVTSQRWGDYSQTIVDPLDDMTVWTVQEYSVFDANFNQNSGWATRVIQLKAPPPATPASATPAVMQGQSNVNVTVTGTSSAGSGFFDPDSSYPNHISASVSGSGVTVNSVTFTDPTHITLNVSVAASAATGVRDITVTNPDGQTATGSGILTVSSSAPAAPTGLSATAGNAKVSLTWMASTGAATYNVKRSTTSGSGYVTIASPSTTTYTDTTVTNDTTYYYVVSGVSSSSAEGPNSTQVQATPTAKPILMSFSPTSGHVGASVTITGDNFTGATGVKFNGATASFTVNSATSITATVPSAATTGPVSVTNASGTTTSTANFTVTATVPFDFNGDGKADLLWQNSATGGVLYWLMNGVQYSGTGGYIVNTATWNVVGVADFNGDGSPDIVWQNPSSGAVVVWYMNGLTYSGNAGTIAAAADPAWKVVGTPDLNGDGHPDILWQNSNTGAVLYWLMNGAQYTGQSGYIVTSTDPAWKVVGTPDLNGDGSPDILWQNSTTGGVYVWYMNGVNYSGNGTYIVTSTDPAWHVVGDPDLNGDGKPDLLWQNSTTGGVLYWIMNGATYTGTGDYIVTSTDLNWHIVGIH